MKKINKDLVIIKIIKESRKFRFTIDFCKHVGICEASYYRCINKEIDPPKKLLEFIGVEKVKNISYRIKG